MVRCLDLSNWMEDGGKRRPGENRVEKKDRGKGTNSGGTKRDGEGVSENVRKPKARLEGEWKH